MAMDGAFPYTLTEYMWEVSRWMGATKVSVERQGCLVALAIVGYASAFAGVGPMQLKPSASSSRAALRAVGPSMKIGVFYGT